MTKHCTLLVALALMTGCRAVPLAVERPRSARVEIAFEAIGRDTIDPRTRLKIVTGRAWLEGGALHVSILVSQPGYETVWTAQAYLDTDRDPTNGEEFVGRFVERSGQHYPVRLRRPPDPDPVAGGYGAIVGQGWLEAGGRSLHTIIPLSAIDDYDGLEVAIGIFTPKGAYVHGWRGTALPNADPIAIRWE